MARWLLHAVNGLGLGHLTRLLAVARQIRHLSPESEFLLLTSSEAANLAWQEGFASVKLPSDMAARRANLQPSTYLRLVHAIARDVAAEFRPHALVADTFPYGVSQELRPVLDMPMKRMLVYRQQKGSDDPGFQAALARYDGLIVPHPEGEAPAPAPYGVPVEFVGHVMLRSSEEALPRDEARRRLGMRAEGIAIYVGFGGGGIPSYQSQLEWALGEARHFPDWEFAFAEPPLQLDALRAPSAANVRPFRHWPLAECWAAFDGAIAAAGYNTVAELLHHGVPAIWVPFQAAVDDQQGRAARAASQGAGWVVQAMDTPALHAALLELSQPQRREAAARQARGMVPSNGARKAAHTLLRWMDS